MFYFFMVWYGLISYETLECKLHVRQGAEFISVSLRNLTSKPKTMPGTQQASMNKGWKGVPIVAQWVKDLT